MMTTAHSSLDGSSAAGTCLPPKRARGVLAMLKEPLPHYPFLPELLQETTHAMRRRARGAKPKVPITTSDEDDNCRTSCEWTLFFLADSHSVNSIRFRPMLVDFVQGSHGECACVCVPNREDDQDVLCGGTGFFCLPWHHDNRAAVLQMLSALVVPSVIVIETSTGRRLTDQGMMAIEANDAQEVLKRWRRKESGLSWGQNLQSHCSIS